MRTARPARASDVQLQRVIEVLLSLTAAGAPAATGTALAA